jgi:hypothetical protein
MCMFLLNLCSVIFNGHFMRFFNLNMKHVIVHIYNYSYVLPFIIVFEKEFLFSCRFIFHLYNFFHSHGCIHCIFYGFLSVFSQNVINIILDCVFIYTKCENDNSKEQKREIKPKTFYFHRRSITCREYILFYLLPEENLSTHAY